MMITRFSEFRQFHSEQTSDTCVVAVSIVANRPNSAEWLMPGARWSRLHPREE